MNTKHHNHHHIGHSLFLAGAFFIIFSLAFLSPLSTVYSKAFGTSDIVTLSNTERTQLSIPELKTNTALNNAAQAKADDMVRLQYFAHEAPDGKMAWDYMKNVGYAYEVAGENLAVTNESAETVINSWMNSPSHKDNLLNPSYQDVGIGIGNYGDYQNHKNTTVIVAMYAKSAGVQVIGAPTNAAGNAAVLKPNYLNISPIWFVGIALVAMFIGSAIEIRHIRKTKVHKK